MDNSSHTLLDLLLEEEMDLSSHHQSHYYKDCERTVLRSMSMDESCSPVRRHTKQPMNRFDAVTMERHHEHHNTNVSDDLAFRARRMNSPRRPERQASLLIHNENDHPDTLRTASQHHRPVHIRPPSSQQPQHPSPLLAVNIQDCGADPFSTMDMQGSGTKLKSSEPTVVTITRPEPPHQHRPECRDTTSPRRPMRQLSGIPVVVAMDTVVVVSPPTILTTTATANATTTAKSMVPKREASPRRPVRRPSVH